MLQHHLLNGTEQLIIEAILLGGRSRDLCIKLLVYLSFEDDPVRLSRFPSDFRRFDMTSGSFARTFCTSRVKCLETLDVLAIEQDACSSRLEFLQLLLSLIAVEI